MVGTCANGHDNRGEKAINLSKGSEKSLPRRQR